MRTLLPFGKSKSEPENQDNTESINGEIFAQLLAIFGTMNDLVLEVHKLRLEVQSLRAGQKDQNGTGSIQTPEGRALRSPNGQAHRATGEGSL